MDGLPAMRLQFACSLNRNYRSEGGASGALIKMSQMYDGRWAAGTATQACRRDLTSEVDQLILLSPPHNFMQSTFDNTLPLEGQNNKILGSKQFYYRNAHIFLVFAGIFRWASICNERKLFHHHAAMRECINFL